ncbi:GapR family DNA-binding domain-containing protein [Shinella sp.]|uniref:GapR family DNA-binding domain-containing protein n=1 Tax=Shinella sp. TaxID=1870904 RepID=UPI003D2689DD
MVASNSAKHRMDRIIRLHEEIDQIKKDIRDIYAEEKAEGGDKTAMGEAITKIRKREKDKDGFDERENMVDVYLMAYNAPSGTAVATHTHAPVDRKARAALRTSEAMDDNKAFSAMMLADGLISEEAHAENIALSNAVARKYGAGVIDPETGEVLDDRRSDNGLNIQTKHEDIRTAPETAEELSRPAPLAGSGGDRSIPSPDAGGVKMDAVQRTPGRPDDMSVHKSAQSGQATTDHKPVSYRPNCIHPENCASGGTDHCWSCRRAMALKEEAA